MDGDDPSGGLKGKIRFFIRQECAGAVDYLIEMHRGVTTALDIQAPGGPEGRGEFIAGELPLPAKRGLILGYMITASTPTVIAI
jgi:hypothetical protein